MLYEQQFKGFHYKIISPDSTVNKELQKCVSVLFFMAPGMHVWEEECCCPAHLEVFVCMLLKNTKFQNEEAKKKKKEPFRT